MRTVVAITSAISRAASSSTELASHASRFEDAPVFPKFYAARYWYALNAWKSVPLGRFSAATGFQLGPISYLLTSIEFSAGFSRKIIARFQSAAVFLFCR
jgi:hypothetical protein